MRKSFIVGIFALAIAVAGATEWASRRSAARAVDKRTSDLIEGSETGLTDAPSVAARGESVGSPGTPQVDGVDTAAGHITRTLVLGGGEGGFRLNALTLSDAAVARIDEMVASLDANATGTHFVIEGHTDSLGGKDVNEKIGLARALAVRQYLEGQYEIPRDRIRVVSYGSEQPVADNTTQEGRVLNRRVVIKVLN